MNEVPYFKKITLEFSTGETIEVDGAYITNVELERNIDPIHRFNEIPIYRSSPQIN